MAYADYTFYTGTYKGNSIPSDDFDRLIARAGAWLTKNGIAESTTDNNVKMAACSVAEAWLTNEQGEVVSQSVGSWSKSIQKEPKSDQDRLFEAANLYLGSRIRKVRWC